MDMSEKTIQEVVDQAIADFDKVKAAIVKCGIEVPYGTDTRLYGDMVESVYGKGIQDGTPQSYIFVDKDGNETVGVLVEKETIFDATVDDVREGKVFATETGVATGEKFIPSYHSSTGYRMITAGSQLTIPTLKKYDRYDFTELQIIVCEYNNKISDSFKSIMVVIDDGLYEVNSLERIATVQKDYENKTIDLGISNETDSPCVIRFFTYKEIY